MTTVAEVCSDLVAAHQVEEETGRPIELLSEADVQNALFRMDARVEKSGETKVQIWSKGIVQTSQPTYYRKPSRALKDGEVVPEVDLSDQEYVAEDYRVWEICDGIISYDKPKVLPTPTNDCIITNVDWTRVPTLSVLAKLYQIFFSKVVDREVAMIYGENLTGGGHTFVVPQQEGSMGGVKYDDPVAIEQLMVKARWLGSLHVHPGSGHTPSGTDVQDWLRPEASGLHIIFDRDAGFGIYAVVAGTITSVYTGAPGILLKAKKVTVRYERSGGKPLLDLLQKSAPPTPITVVTSSGVITTPIDRGTHPSLKVLRGHGGFYVSNQEVPKLRLIKANWGYWIMSEAQWARAQKSMPNVKGLSMKIQGVSL